MNKSNITEGKALMLKKAHDRLNFNRDKKWKVRLLWNLGECIFMLICTNLEATVCVSMHFSLLSYVNICTSRTFVWHTAHFPNPGDIMCYCGAEFSTKPPCNVPNKICNRIDANNTKTDRFYSCSEGCIHNNPWVIPISMEGISLNNINNLPLTFNVYHRCYKLGGCTMNTGGHFVAILLWHGTHYFYDGIKSTKQQWFIEYNPGF